MKKLFLLSLMAMLLPLSMWAQEEAEAFDVKAKNVVYAGDETATKVAEAIEVKVGGDLLALGTDYQIAYYSLTGEGEPLTETRVYAPRNVGKYKAVISGASTSEKYFEFASVNVTFEVTKLAVDPKVVKLNEVTMEYAGKELSLDDILEKLVTVDTNYLVTDTKEEIANFLAGLKVVAVEKEFSSNVGTYSVAVDGDETATSNYIYTRTATGDHVAFVINPKPLTLTMNGRVYDGKVFDPATLSMNHVKKDGVEGLLDGDEITNVSFTCDQEIKDAKTYELTATINDEGTNYTINPVIYEVRKAPLTITPKKNYKTYGDEDPESLIGEGEDAAYNVTGWKNNETPEDYNFSLIREEGSNVGKYIVRPAKNNKTFSTGSYETALNNYKIVDYVPTADENKFEIKAMDLSEDKNIIVTIKDQTYKGAEFTVIAAADITVMNGKVKFTDYEQKVTTKGTNVGDDLTVTITFTGNYTGTKEVKVNIVQAQLTIKAKEDANLWKLYDGYSREYDMVEEFTDNGTLQGSDKAGGLKGLNIAMKRDKSTSVGKKEIFVYVNDTKVDDTNKGTALENYVINYEQAYYEILANNITLDGASEADEVTSLIDAYAGKEVNVTVTNLKSVLDLGIAAENWYPLVLPFEITVRELSEKFGYAIVNVPNTANTDEKKIVFKLTMGTIPANTLMLFKTDQGLNWEETYPTGVNFGMRAIVAPDPTQWAKDAAGNNFFGVYEVTTIESAQDYFLWNYTDTETGELKNSFYQASMVGGTDIYPLSGYVHFGTEVDPAEARILIEEADGSTTAINVVNVNKINVAEGWYTIGGMKLNAEPTQKGIYINNGKKVVIK